MADVLSWIVGLGVFGVGAAAGIALGLTDRAAQRRERELRAEIEAERQSFDAYRTRVTDHMSETAHLLRDLTHRHAALYRHLAAGARALSAGAAEQELERLAEPVSEASSAISRDESAPRSREAELDHPA